MLLGCWSVVRVVWAREVQVSALRRPLSLLDPDKSDRDCLVQINRHYFFHSVAVYSSLVPTTLQSLQEHSPLFLSVPVHLPSACVLRV
jgi:hypothetical protein